MPHQDTLIVGSFHIACPTGKTAGAIKTSNIEPVHEADGQAVKGPNGLPMCPPVRV